MTLHPLAKKSLVIGSMFLCLGVLVGAFGAHGLKNIVSPEKLVTFETGVRYHFYHALGMILIALVQQTFQNLRLNVSYYSFFVGILLFSCNCYFYALTDIKTFAMVVPLGGLMFVLGWGALTFQALKLR
ncbi:DUF423 domain-containing protein [Peredibacter starrii]|uniref:DUF423 domain-containing protein n=1 Tax=Peredibacter starrii TaxID=28202 RepID=A0AAX4HTC8_9BACT|nr:DUF423 domain-containing protein [Peredibacter starrii]WPU66428.1 DUF423 domain-containing protein [Peredibacter starrii]